MILVLIRHGRTEANEKRLYCGCTDLPLSAAGRAELKLKAENIAYPSTAGLRVCTSGMRRTNETLQIIYGIEPESYIPDLAEMDFGRFEMHSYDQLKNDPAYVNWIMDADGNVHTDGGESTGGFHARVFRALDALDRDSLIVTHGGVITAIMGRLFPEENKGFYDWQPDCGEGYVIDTAAHTYRKIGADEHEA